VNEQSVQELQEALTAAREVVAPKQKFSFRSRKKVCVPVAALSDLKMCG